MNKMLKFSALVIIGSFSCLSFALAQQNHNVLNWNAEKTLNKYLMSQMHRQYDQRDSILKLALQSPSTLRSYQESLKENYLKMLGDLPDRSDLKVEITGTIKQPNYTIEKIIYQSQPGHYVTANLYLPRGNGPFPGILLLCGHESDAKVAPFNQKTAILLAMQKFVVMVVDPISQGERHQLFDESEQQLTRGGTTEHTILNAGANLVGSSIVAHELWDNVRAIDYLESRSEVDQERIGCLGSSGGGTQTTYLMAYDDRIKVAAPGSFITRREGNFMDHGADDGCQHLPGEGANLFELSDFLILFAPKPLLILAGEYDFVDYEGTQDVYHELKQVYQLAEKKEQVELFSVQDGHGMSKPKQEAAIKWFMRWFYQIEDEISEPEYQILPKEELYCTRSGQVMIEFPDALSVRDLQQQRFSKLQAEWDQVNVDLPARVRLSLNNPEPETEFNIEKRVMPTEEYWDKHILRTSNSIPIPLLLKIPDSPQLNKVEIWLPKSGKKDVADSLMALQQSAGKTTAYVLADLAGIGETTDPVRLNDPKFYNSEYRNAMTAIHVGTTLVAHRVREILMIMKYVGQHPQLKNLPVYLYADGSTAVPALQAAVLDTDLTGIILNDCPSSFSEVIQSPQIRYWYSIVVPGILQLYDLPELSRYLNSRVRYR